MRKLDFIMIFVISVCIGMCFFLAGHNSCEESHHAQKNK